MKMDNEDAKADLPADAAYERWLRDYRKRRVAFRDEVIQASQESWKKGLEESQDPNVALAKAILHARSRRSTLTRKFCLFLWSRNFNQALFNEITDGAELDRSREDAVGLLRSKAARFRSRIRAVTGLLDRAGLFTLMLFPDGTEGAPPEPLVLEVPGEMDMWFHLFKLFAELSQAIIIEGNYGRGEFKEMQYIQYAGLAGRVLLFDNDGSFYRDEDDRRWQFGDLDEAVAYAAAQQVISGSTTP